LPLACAADCYIWERGCLIFRDCKALSVACSAINVRSLRGHDGALNEAPTSLFFLHFFFPVYYFFFSHFFFHFFLFSLFFHSQCITFYFFIFSTVLSSLFFSYFVFFPQNYICQFYFLILSWLKISLCNFFSLTIYYYFSLF